MILLPESQKDEACKIAEKIRSDIQNIKWEQIKSVTVSLGVAELLEDDDIQSLYKRVDNRLYYAKTHGKNQVTSQDL